MINTNEAPTTIGDRRLLTCRGSGAGGAFGEPRWIRSSALPPTAVGS
jgi:hypothetical protein